MEQAFARMDAHALDTPQAKERSISSLTRYLSEPASNDFEKARAIFCWIAHNIDYDTESYFSETDPVTNAGDLLTHRRSVCSGYANLFASLATEAGLTAYVIQGYAKGYSYSVNKKIDFSDTNHAWNGVVLEGKLYLLDNTWGAGYVDDSRRFVRRYEDFYFLTPPEQFIFRHLPEDPQWQLLDDTVTQGEYVQMLNLHPAFFKNGLQLKSHQQATIKARERVTIELIAPTDTLLLATPVKNKQSLPKSLVFMQRDKELVTVDLVFPEKGNYTLLLYAKKEHKEGNYRYAFEYTINVKKAKKKVTPYPQTFNLFMQYCYLYAPLNGTLQEGSTVGFEIKVKQAEKVSVVVYNKWFHLHKDGDIFTGTVTIPKGKRAVLYAQFPDHPQYSGLLEYTIVP
jgi:hypothetical protein